MEPGQLPPGSAGRASDPRSPLHGRRRPRATQQGIWRKPPWLRTPWKSLLIAVALLVLVLHKNFWMARVGLWIAAEAYTLLNVYHLTLF
jgi:hypothetical protein